MEEERNPELTCPSKITGRLVRVRHALEADVVFIEAMLKRFRLDSTRLDYRRYVVADEDGAVIGFGTLEQVDGAGTHIGIFVDEGQEYLSELIARHLAEYPRGAES
jgi:N-acetylglutamate synthase-like GNAT family acetyltransferase